MQRYSTPTLTIETDIDDLSSMDALWVSFKQDKKILRKTKDNLEIENNIIKVELTQEETGIFSAYDSLKMQVRWLKAGKSGGSNIVSFSLNDVLEDEVITSEDQS